MGRSARLRILLGACIVGMIGVIVHSHLLIGGAVVLLVLSGLRYPQSVPTNYTEKFGPPDTSDLPDESPATPFSDIKTEDDGDSKD